MAMVRNCIRAMERVCAWRIERNHAFKHFREMFLGTCEAVWHHYLWSNTTIFLKYESPPLRLKHPDTVFLFQSCSASFVHISVNAGLMCDACKTGSGAIAYRHYFPSAGCHYFEGSVNDAVNMLWNRSDMLPSCGSNTSL